MKKSLVKGVALVAASVLGITGLSLAPANAATRTVAVVQETNTLSGLNTAIPGKNLVTNVDVLYPTGAGFTYWNNKAQLVRNTAFGTFKITKNVPGDFQVTYTIKKGLKWSDGTLITGQDLLLSHAISSSKYSIAAGMGDPSPAGAADPTNKFDSAGYGGPYDDHTFADSFDLSEDNYSVTVKYDSFQPDWQIFGPGPTDVAALVALAKGKKTLQSARTNAAYKNLFEDAYYNAYEALPASNDEDYQDALDARTASRALLAQIAKKWSTVWNITSVTSSTNPLLLISNGGFMIDTINSTSATLKRNPLASVSGAPKVTGNIDTFVFKFPASGATFNDVAAAQALANKEIDAYSGAANAAVWSTLKANTNATTIQASSATYEHLDIRTGTANTGANPDCAATYTGPFAGESAKAKDLRHAFMLVVPRQLISNTYIGKVFDPNTTANSTVLNSNLVLTTEGSYSKQVAGLKTYVDEFSKSQADRNALALALVKKWYQSAGVNSNTIDVKYLRSTAARRADINLQIKLEAAKVGFNVTNVGNSAWPNFLDCNDYDVADFAWSRSSISQTGSNANYITEGGNNGYGWSDSAVDAAFNVFEGALSATELVTAQINAEKLLYSHYWSLPLYQWPGVASWNSDLKGVLYNPLNPNLVWNYWAWTY
jgi:peptide/nickel transport system substrate-binding protein